MAGLLAILIYYEWATITRMSETNSTGNARGWFAVAVIAGNTIFGEPSLDLPLLSGFTLTAALFPVLRGRNWWLVGGIVYAGLSGISLAAIRGDELTGFVAILFIFAVVWSTDILAYFVGRAIGGQSLRRRFHRARLVRRYRRSGGRIDRRRRGVSCLSRQDQPAAAWARSHSFRCSAR